MRIIRILGITALIVSLSLIVFAAETKRKAKIIDVSGKAMVKLDGKSWVPAEIGMVLKDGDILKTSSDSFVMLNLDGKGQTATVEIEENSQLLLSELVKDDQAKTQKTLLDLALGKILIKVQKLHTEESRFEVKTPTSIVGVRGTVFAVEVESLE